MEDRRKVYVEVRARHLIDGTCRPESIKFENDEVYEIDRVKHCCRAASTVHVLNKDSNWLSKIDYKSVEKISKDVKIFLPFLYVKVPGG